MNRKVEFLERLFKLASCMEELIEFLKEEKLMNDHQIQTIKSETEKSRLIYMVLENLRRDDKLLLLDYEWILLPVERLKLTIITERNRRDFNYNF